MGERKNMSSTTSIKLPLLLLAVLCLACSYGNEENIVAEDEFRSPSASTGTTHKVDARTTEELTQAGWWRRRRRADEIANKRNERGHKERGHKERGHKERAHKGRARQERAGKERKNKSATANKNQSGDPVIEWRAYQTVHGRYLEKKFHRNSRKKRFMEQWKNNRKTGKTKWVFVFPANLQPPRGVYPAPPPPAYHSSKKYAERRRRGTSWKAPTTRRRRNVVCGYIPTTSMRYCTCDGGPCPMPKPKTPQPQPDACHKRQKGKCQRVRGFPMKLCTPGKCDKWSSDPKAYRRRYRSTTRRRRENCTRVRQLGVTMCAPTK